MDILILGNGFDLAHKLDTKYNDFLKYCQEKYSSKSIGADHSNNFLYNNVWVKHFLNKTLAGDKWIDLENEIYNVITKLCELPYFKNGISYEKYEDIVFLFQKIIENLILIKLKNILENQKAFFMLEIVIV